MAEAALSPRRSFLLDVCAAPDPQPSRPAPDSVCRSHFAAAVITLTASTPLVARAISPYRVM